MERCQGSPPRGAAFRRSGIASDLHNRGEEIDDQRRQVRTDATQYEATTNSLLARLPELIQYGPWE